VRVLGKGGAICTRADLARAPNMAFHVRFTDSQVTFDDAVAFLASVGVTRHVPHTFLLASGLACARRVLAALPKDLRERALGIAEDEVWRMMREKNSRYFTSRDVLTVTRRVMRVFSVPERPHPEGMKVFSVPERPRHAGMRDVARPLPSEGASSRSDECAAIRRGALGIDRDEIVREVAEEDETLALLLALLVDARDEAERIARHVLRR